MKFRSELLPFGANVRYKLAQLRNVNLLKRFGDELRVGIFAGYRIVTGAEKLGSSVSKKSIRLGGAANTAEKLRHGLQQTISMR